MILYNSTAHVRPLTHATKSFTLNDRLYSICCLFILNQNVRAFRAQTAQFTLFPNVPTGMKAEVKGPEVALMKGGQAHQPKSGNTANKQKANCAAIQFQSDL